MTVSPAILLLSISIGGPLLLLALGVLYYAYVLGRQQAVEYDDQLGAHVEALATESTDALLIDLRDAVEHMQGQLSRQRESLAGLLSDDARTMRPAMAASAPLMAPLPSMPTTPERESPMRSPMQSAQPAREPLQPRFLAPTEPERPAAGSFVYSTRPAQPAPTGTQGAAGSLAQAVAGLLDEGLSDRAIARQLHIGLEEVRMARMRNGRS